MTTPTLHILAVARGILNHPDRWTKGAWAKSATCDDVPPWRPEATCWCLEGAIQRAARESRETVGDRYMLYADDALFHTAESSGFDSRCELIDWNDAPTTTHAMVLEVLDRAIAAERAKL